MAKENIEDKANEFGIRVYLDDGRVFCYSVSSAEKVREHMSAIVWGGYRHNDGKGLFEHYPPHRISKVQCNEYIPTNYPDEVEGT